MGGEWLDRWEDEQDERRAANARRRRENERLRAMSDPQWALDNDEEDEVRDDWWERKYGPDPADVAFEKARAIAEDRDDEPAEDEDFIRAEWDEDNDVDEAKLARHDREE